MEEERLVRMIDGGAALASQSIEESDGIMSDYSFCSVRYAQSWVEMIGIRSRHALPSLDLNTCTLDDSEIKKKSRGLAQSISLLSYI